MTRGENDGRREVDDWHDLLVDLRRMVQDHLDEERDWRLERREHDAELLERVRVLEKRPTEGLTRDDVEGMRRMVSAARLVENRCWHSTFWVGLIILSVAAVTHAGDLLLMARRWLHLE